MTEPHPLFDERDLLLRERDLLEDVRHFVENSYQHCRTKTKPIPRDMVVGQRVLARINTELKVLAGQLQRLEANFSPDERAPKRAYRKSTTSSQPD